MRVSLTDRRRGELSCVDRMMSGRPSWSRPFQSRRGRKRLLVALAGKNPEYRDGSKKPRRRMMEADSACVSLRHQQDISTRPVGGTAEPLPMFEGCTIQYSTVSEIVVIIRDQSAQQPSNTGMSCSTCSQWKLIKSEASPNMTT
ncbi:hypothetical protein BaRGS_00036051 [Batillaria attramentaria]|uniref:Uncharacterized protein n=1 Tax=Batillaria attramentaria TaxID=370345 RepID=A0ABD0JCW1_9CAEN